MPMAATIVAQISATATTLRWVIRFCGKKGTIIHDAHPWRILVFPLCRSSPELGSARLADHSASRGGSEGSESANASRHEAEMEVYADACVTTCYPSPASQQQDEEGLSPAAEERPSAMDDATPTEQSALASSSPASSVGYGQSAAKPRRAGESTAARRWSGDLGTCDAH